MSVEDLLTDELRTVAGGVQAPPPPAPSHLVQRARRERSRRRRRTLAGAGLVAATVVAAVALGVHAGHPDAAPGPTHPTGTPSGLPTGDAPLVPYVVFERLYVNDEPVPGTWWDVQTVQGHTVATRGVPPIGKPVLFDNQDQPRPTHLLDHAIGTARLSVDGTKLAWIETTGSSAHVVVRDLPTGETLGRLTVDPNRVFIEDGTQDHILWLGDDGTVVYGGSSSVRTWRPGSPATPSDVGLQQVKGYPVDYSEISFSPDGNWAAWRSDRRGRTTDRKDFYDGVTFESPRNPDTRFTIALPAGTNVHSVTWESATDVLLRYQEQPGAAALRFMRCSVEDKHCELAPTQADP